MSIASSALASNYTLGFLLLLFSPVFVFFLDAFFKEISIDDLIPLLSFCYQISAVVRQDLEKQVVC